MEEVFKTRKFQLATFDRVEGEFAVLRFDNGQTMNWPKNELPAGVSEGDVLKVVLLNKEDEEEEREAMAKAVLNELLKTD